MALLETKEKTANSLGFRQFKMNPGIAAKLILLLERFLQKFSTEVLFFASIASGLSIDARNPSAIP
jgi:hypothetical protein